MTYDVDSNPHISHTDVMDAIRIMIQATGNITLKDDLGDIFGTFSAPTVTTTASPKQSSKPKPFPPTTSQEFAKSVAISAASSTLTWAWGKALPAVKTTLRRQVVTSLKLSGSVQITRVLKFISDKCKIFINFTDLAATSDDLAIPVSGTCVFQCEGRLYWLQSVRNTDTRGGKAECSMVLSTYGRDPSHNTRLCTLAFRHDESSTSGNSVVIRIADGNGHINTMCSITTRPLKNILKSEEVQKNVIDVIDQWLTRKDWYHEKGFAYKKTFILHGPPGSGKTSLVRSLAAEIGYSILIVDFQNFTDESLLTLFATKIEKRTVVLFEDFDADDIVLDRAIKNQPKSNTDDVSDKNVSYARGKTRLTLKGILNALQGMIPLDEILVFMTTNVLRDIDPALTRPGRVDGIVYVGEVGDSEIKRYINDIFPDYIIPDVTFHPILGCRLEALYFEHQLSPDDWVDAIPKL